jgi:hypothetical protein
MASPTVWTTARARIQAVATAEAVTVAWPNEATQEPGALIWDGFAFPPGGALSDDGNWTRYTLGISYRYTDA